MAGSRMVRVFILCVAAAAWVLPGSPAAANHHVMRIREVSAGTPEQPDAEFVELQMLSNNQNITNNSRLRFYDAAEQVIATFVLPGDVATGLAQQTVLIATAAAQTLYSVTADFTMPAAMSPAGGKVCFERRTTFEQLDCVAWGNYIDDGAVASGEAGTPFNGAEGLLAGSAMLRGVSGGTNPNGIDAGDDTNDSAADFAFAAPTPRANSGAEGAAPGGVIAFSAPVTTAGEGDGVAQITVTRAGGTGSVSVDYAAVDGTAVAGSDYTATAGTLTFTAPGASSFSVPLVDDGVTEGTETIALTIRNPLGGAALGTQPDAQASILPATLSLVNRTVAEGSDATAPMAFTVRASDPTIDGIQATVSTLDGTARANSDFAALIDAPVTIAPGATTTTAVVTRYGDDANELRETFSLVLDDVTGATLGAAVAIGTLNNDDVGPRCTIEGTIGDDTDLVGTAGNNVICGLAGDDVIFGGDGNDTLIGGPGADTLNGEGGNDTLMPGAGDDPMIDGGSGLDTVSYDFTPSASGVVVDLTGTVTGGLGTDTLFNVERGTGTPHDDSLTGTAGPNTLTGRGGADSLFGLGGNDFVVPGSGDDPVVDGGTGVDTVDYRDVTTGGVVVDLGAGTGMGAGGSDSLVAVERAYGTNFDDELAGTNFANFLLGFGGDDQLFGLLGNDRLDGGVGNDSCTGGGGTDTFIACETAA